MPSDSPLRGTLASAHRTGGGICPGKKRRGAPIGGAAPRRTDAFPQWEALPLTLFCDDDRLPDPLAVVRSYLKTRRTIGRGSLLRVIIRARNPARRADLARAFAALPVDMRIAGDMTLARALGCGLHLPQSRIGEICHWRAISPQPVTIAAHSFAALLAAARFGADAAFLSPVFPTDSHPGAAALGAARATGLARTALLPVWALGGITRENAGRLSGIYGIAGISLLKNLR